jgi:hypothetical protein
MQQQQRFVFSVSSFAVKNIHTIHGYCSIKDLTAHIVPFFCYYTNPGNNTMPPTRHATNNEPVAKNIAVWIVARDDVQI